MLSINNISMRFGARILFEDVTCTFLPGRRYAITGPNGAGKSTLMKILTGEIEPAKGSVTRPKKFGVLRQDQFAFDAFRVIDTVIMGNAPLWKALAERDALYAKPHDELTDEDGMRLGELEGIVGEEGGYTAESDAAVLLDGLGVEDSAARTPHERTAGRPEGPRAAGAGALRHSAGAAARRADQPPRSRFGPLAAGLPVRLRGRADRDLARPPLPEQRLHPRRRYRLRNRHHCTPAATTTWCSPRRRSARASKPQNAQREKKIAQLNEFIARFSAGTRSSQVTSRKKEVERLQTSELAQVQHPAAVHPLRDEAALGPASAGNQGLAKSYDDLKVINNFTASVSRGEKIALMGRNGAGKTTLLKSLIRSAPGFIEDADRHFRRGCAAS